MSNTIRRRRRSKRPTKRFDHTDMTQTLESLGFSRGIWTAMGVVLDSEDGGPHFDLDGEDMTVDVQLMPSGDEITVRVGTVAGGFYRGIWAVPPVGAEVKVSVPDGDLAFQPVIDSWYSSGQLPEGIGEATLVIAAPPGGEIYLHDGSGTLDALVKKSAYEAHKHPTGTGPSGVADNALSSSSYTSVVKAK